MAKITTIAAICGAAAVLLPANALACPVCFGVTDSPVADGVNLAILVLLGVTGTVLGGFAAFFRHLVRQARAARAAAEARIES
jgi:hypothetical protein